VSVVGVREHAATRTTTLGDPLFIHGRRSRTVSARVHEKEDAVLKCREFAEIATAYLEGALSSRERLAALFHLRLCGPCRRYLGQVRATISLLGSGPPPPPPENESEIIALLKTARRDP